MKRSFDQVNNEGLGKVIADHYNKIQELGIEQRDESKIIGLRRFNNWIKSMVLNEFIDLTKNNCHANPNNIKVLDIGCGKGGDLQKYSACGIKHLICTDIAETSLDQCKDRYETMKNRDRGLFSCDFIPADATKDNLQDKFPDRLKNVLVDLTVIQFAYHYSFETIEQATKMLENASRNLREGGYLVGTTVNANKVMAKTLNQKKLKFGNNIFSIEFPAKALDYEKVPLFGNTYLFHLDGVVDCPEFLIHFQTVVQIAKKFNLELHFHKRFEDYYLENLYEPNAKKLLQKIRALKPFPLDEFDKQEMTDEQIAEEYEKATNYLKTNPNIVLDDNKRIGTLSKSEWEAIKLYMVFAFKKISPKRK